VISKDAPEILLIFVSAIAFVYKNEDEPPGSSEKESLQRLAKSTRRKSVLLVIYTEEDYAIYLVACVFCYHHHIQ